MTNKDKYEMTNKDKYELMKLICKIMVMGEHNSLIRHYFNITNKQDWVKFIDKHLKTLR
tara:strand:- start:295 stop:471 length:177 start_codon:yes stop_codon:yes gene_type:complete